jgi:branched-chain amino acid transport system permease protein
MEVWLQLLVNGISIGAVYSLFALGYTLVFSVLGVINFAHGAVFTCGAYFTYIFLGGVVGSNGLLATQKLPVTFPLAIALVLAGFTAAMVGLLVETVAFKPLRRRGAEPLLYLITSLGAGVIIVNLIQLLMGAEAYALPSNILGSMPAVLAIGHGLQIRTVQLLLLIVGGVTMLILNIWLNQSLSGKALQAVAEDTTTARLLGINSGAMIQLAFAIASFLAGLSGGLVALSVNIGGPYFGISYGLKGLGVLVLGGLGSVPGAMLGGLIIGITEAFVPAKLSAYKDAVAFAFLFLVLIIRPQGLFGKPPIEKV